MSERSFDATRSAGGSPASFLPDCLTADEPSALLVCDASVRESGQTE